MEIWTLKHKFWQCLFIIMLFVLCAAKICKAKEEVKFIQEILSGLESPVDVAVSPEGEMYALDQGLAKVMVFTPDGKLKLSFGEKGHEPGKFVSPQAIALMHNGNVVIVDTGNSRVQVFLPNGEFAYLLGNSGSREGEFKKPVAAAMDPRWNLHVIDETKRTITKYSPRGVFLKEWAAEYRPKDIAFDMQGSMYVLYPEAGKILKYSSTEKAIKEITMEGPDGNFIMHAQNISVDHRGDIYLVGDKGHSVRKIDQAHNLLFAFGSLGPGRGQFAMPSGITADEKDRVYVADTKNKRLQVFAVEGSKKDRLLPAGFSDPVLDFENAIPASGNIVDLDLVEGKGLYALSDYYAHILRRGESSQVLGEAEKGGLDLADPQALHVFKDGRMLVADTGHNQLKFLKADGSYDYQFGKKGKDQSQFDNLEGVAVNSKGYIYVADTKNHRIQIFNGDGIYLDSFGKPTATGAGGEPEPGSFLYPKDLVFDGRDQLYVLDSKNRRVQIFDARGKFLREIGGAGSGISFADPVDIDVDENNYLYVADRGRHKVCIINTSGEKVTEFGSAGQGPSHFPKLSAIKSRGGKIYVADYDVNDVKVFSFATGKKAQAERYYVTKVSKPLKMANASPEIIRTMSRKLTVEEAKTEFKAKYGLSEEILKGMEIESEEILPGGQLKMTISVPKQGEDIVLSADEMVSIK